ncbi:TadE family protein [Herminiimonas arsenitoxidans]|uniref:TadE family protein n=1 Tax=Herminiimonas arsenitoxidans TaxID=1809410 RepID=UPI0009714A9D
MKSQSVVRRNNVHTPKKQRGAAAIEFAAVFPIFFMIFYAIITYGMIFVAQQSITLAAAEGARAALRVGSATNPAEIDANREENARRAATGTGSVAYWLMPRLAFAPSLAPCGYNSPANSSIRCYSVTVTYPYKQYPLVPLLLGPLMNVVIPTQLSSTAIIQID